MRQRRWHCRSRRVTTRTRSSPSLPTQQASAFQRPSRRAARPLQLFNWSNYRKVCRRCWRQIWLPTPSPVRRASSGLRQMRWPALPMMQFARSSWRAKPRCRSTRVTPTRFVVFRDAMGGSPVAIIVGKPDFTNAVPVRLHSACLTGDVFGSRRCDCGDQLRLALALLEDLGGGVILYLAQEGRGLGLANKMRTYQLQDDGLDTFDANTTLGFDDDERDYGIAARMLRILNCTRIVLLTNNPTKLDGLTKAGIEIASRMPLEAPINADNRRYMTAKAARAGHRFDHLTASLADQS